MKTFKQFCTFYCLNPESSEASEKYKLYLHGYADAQTSTRKKSAIQALSTSVAAPILEFVQESIYDAIYWGTKINGRVILDSFSSNLTIAIKQHIKVAEHAGLNPKVTMKDYNQINESITTK